MKRKPSIEELQAILDDPREKDIYINPDGSITTSKRKRGCKKWKRTQQPLTAAAQNGHENLGSGGY